MKYYSVFDKNSKLFTGVKSVFGFDSSLNQVQQDTGHEYVVLEGQYSDKNYLMPDLVSVGIITTEKPSKLHKFNINTQTWEIPEQYINRIKSDKLIEINQHREKLINEPITYQNITFDADQEAQRNILTWTSAIANGTTLPSGFTWRDYYNQNHPVTQEFLTGLAQAITLRGTQIYQISWQKKQELEAITSAEAAYNYDTTTGWS